MNKHSLDIRTLIEAEKNMTADDKEKRQIDLQSKSDATLSSLNSLVDVRKQKAEEEAVKVAADEEAEKQSELKKLARPKGK